MTIIPFQKSLVTFYLFILTFDIVYKLNIVLTIHSSYNLIVNLYLQLSLINKALNYSAKTE